MLESIEFRKIDSKVKLFLFNNESLQIWPLSSHPFYPRGRLHKSSLHKYHRNANNKITVTASMAGNSNRYLSPPPSVDLRAFQESVPHQYPDFKASFYSNDQDLKSNNAATSSVVSSVDSSSASEASTPIVPSPVSKATSSRGFRLESRTKKTLK